LIIASYADNITSWRKKHSSRTTGTD